MRFQKGLCNPTEALIGMQFIYLITSIIPSLWSYQISKYLLMYLIIPILCFSSILTFFSSLKQIYIHEKYNLNSTIKLIFRGYSALFLVIICSLIYIPFQSIFYKEHSLICLIVLTIPWNYSIYRTIIIEITNDKTFNTFSVLLGQSPILIPIISAHLFPSLHLSSIILSIIFSGLLYIYTVHFTLREVCQALAMKHFWTVKNDSSKH
jgi:hypothetical protein